MRTLVAFDSFKGTIPSVQACQLAVGVLKGEVDPCPLSDGGEGLLEVVADRRLKIRTRDPLGRLQSSAVGFLGATGLIEVAQIVGLPEAVARGKLDPVRASTAGLASAIRFMKASGVESLVVGCGGSATTDGGVGLVAELIRRGYEQLPIPTVVLFDVSTSFVGAAAEFGPQKGAKPGEVVLLGRRLEALSLWYRRRFGVEVAELRGAGAAGGLAGALAAMGAKLVPGLEWVSSVVELERRVAEADRVVTGEGRLDAGSFSGKVVGEVLKLAERFQKPSVVVAGSADPNGCGSAERLGARVISMEQEYGLEACMSAPEATLVSTLGLVAKLA